MIRPLELYIGLRYIRAKRRNHFISFISLMATLGIVLGVAVLITVLSVMNGFGNELRTRILGAVAHIKIESTHKSMQNWRNVVNKLSETEGIRGVAPYVSGQGMLISDLDSRGTLIRGIIPSDEKKVANFHLRMAKGKLSALQPGRFGIIVGSELAWRLGLDLGSRVSLLSSRAQVTPMGLLPRYKRFTVVGIFEMGISQFDGGLGLIHLEDARRLYQTGEGITGVRLQLDDLFSAPQLARQLTSKLDPDLHTIDWTQEHASFFRALRIEKTAMFIVMILAIAIAAFNIISMLVMLVTDKQSDIAILKTLGMSSDRIMKIFILNGTILGVVGTLAGALSGILLATYIDQVVKFFEQALNVQLFTADIYYYSGLKGEIRVNDVVWIMLSSIVLTISATIYPARRAAAVQPARALHIE